MSEENNSLNNSQQDNRLPDPQDSPENQDVVSKVASTPKQRKIFAMLLIAAGILASYYVFHSSTHSKQDEKERKAKEIEMKKEELAKSAQPVTTGDNIEITKSKPKNLTPQPLPEPKAPEPPPPPLPPTPPTPFGNRGGDGSNPSIRPLPNASSSILRSNKEDEEEKKRLAAKMKAKIIVVSGGELQASSEDEKDKDKKSKDELKKLEGSQAGFLGFGDGQFTQDGIANTSFAPVKATKMSDTEYLITEGKIIDAVLETGINSDLPGTVRATISRDVYGGSGKNILIPQGSSVIGSYQSDVKDGQTRIAVTWKRLIMPDGIDLAIDSPAVDHLGRAGVTGDVDTHFWAKMASAFLVSYVIPMVTNSLAGVNKDQIQVLQNTGSTGTSSGSGSGSGTGSTGTVDTSNTGGSVVVGGTVKAMQLKESSAQFNKILTDSVKNTFQNKPTITIDQGTKISIMVQKDLLIPYAVIANRKTKIME